MTRALLPRAGWRHASPSVRPELVEGPVLSIVEGHRRGERCTRRVSAWSPLATALLLAACAQVDFDRGLADANRDAAAFTRGQLQLARNAAADRAGAQRADALLTASLGQAEAVELALVHSPALQALLAERWADAAATAQSARIANPVFSFERVRTGCELDISRVLSFGLFDLLTLPARRTLAEQRLAAGRLQLTGEVVDHVTQLRQAWVRAVAARERLGYARQVLASAEVSAELARRMQAVGNWSRLTRARQQLFYADAAAQAALAEQAERSTREQLVRLLGLHGDQVAALKLPERLPDVPRRAAEAEVLAAQAPETRLDVRLARARVDAAARAQGLGRVTSVLDVEAGVHRGTVWPAPGAAREPTHGWNVALRLPLFDGGGVRREALNAQTLAAVNALEAATRAAESQLRESYASYRTAWALARHQRDEVVPLRQLMQEENLLRYNAMLIGVFELLADAREQVQSVQSAISAAEQFWLADAALQASLIGRPTSMALEAARTSGGNNAQTH